MKNVRFLTVILVCLVSISSCKNGDVDEAKIGASIEKAISSPIYAGEITIGVEVSVFVTEGKEYWLEDETGEIQKRYVDVLGNGQAPYTPIYAELKGEKLPKAEDGFAADYDGVFKASEIVKLEKISQQVED